MRKTNNEPAITPRRKELLESLLDNLQEDSQYTMQVLDILQGILLKPQQDMNDKNRLVMACAMLKLHCSTLLNTVLRLKYGL